MSIKDKCDEITKNVQARLSGWDKGPQLFESIQDKDERIAKLTDQVVQLQEKFDRMWQAWHGLAVATKGAEEASKMAEALKHGQ